MMNKQVQYIKSNSQYKIKLDLFFVKYKNYTHLDRSSYRYDFADEWNNLSYGKIPSDETKWSLSDIRIQDEQFVEVIGHIVDIDWTFICVYCGIKEENGVATLYFNREAGPIDGLDYFIVEDFLLNYKVTEFGSPPILSEIPYGYKSAVTMRIDCDENISSGNQLFDLYKEMRVPFSMAIKTSLDFTKKNIESMLLIIESGGSIVSHSHTHAPNWGGSREKAKWEAEKARSRLKEVLPENYTYDYVVSPFHQNPRYAIQGLVDAGIKGFIGGSIKNDPEYLQARAGYVLTGENIITHSQQCMLHGDCFHASGLDVYKQTFSNHYQTNTFFGFLDHPFSNYTYGWNSEEERIMVHREFLQYIKSHDNIWFANLIDAMNFLWVKSNTKIWVENDELKWQIPKHNFKIPSLKVFWKNTEVEINENRI